MLQRVPKPFVEEVRGQTEIVDVIQSNLPITKEGSLYKTRCPFHNENDIPLYINPRKQIYYCPACGSCGDAFSFIMQYERIDFPSAVRKLAKIKGIDIPINKPDDSGCLTDIKRLQQANSHAAKRYHKNICEEEAQNYLLKRQIDTRSVQVFGLGYAPNSFDYIASTTKEDWIDINIQAGLLKESTMKPGNYYDFFRNRLIFPIRNVQGNTIGFSGRTLDATSTAKYINTPETPLFKKSLILYGLYEALTANKILTELLVVEGQLDVISMFSIGLTNTVASMGSTFTSYHCDDIFQHVNKVTFIFDGDKAGYRAAIKAAITILPYLHDGRKAQFVLLEQEQDPDSMIKSGNSSKIKNKISHSICITTFLFNHATAISGEQSEISNRSKACLTLLSYLKIMPDSCLKEIFISDISQAMNICSKVIRNRINQLQEKNHHTGD